MDNPGRGGNIDIYLVDHRC